MRYTSRLVMSVLTASMAVTFLVGMGGGRPPGAGEGVAQLFRQAEPAPDLPGGFLVWSSNRSGNHDIFKMTLPDKRITRLTDHPHAEYFPRISPDGRYIVFSRARKPKVSQRNHRPWDVILLDLDTGEQRLLAAHGNTPTWSPDGRRVFFQRQATEFVEHDLRTGRESIVFKSGTGQVNKGAGLQTPHSSPDGRRLAVTLRGAQHLTGIVDAAGTITMVSDGCQLTWTRRGDALYYVDYGGRMKNAFYAYDPARGKSRKWLDVPGEFSHEYFPKLSNDERYLAFGASRSVKDHEHDRADYEIFLWQIGTPPESIARLTFHRANDAWPDVYLNRD